jgi:hypothetical protein
MLFAGVDIKNMEEVVVQWVIKTELDGEEKRWEEEMWGFEDELSEKMFNEDIFSDVEETGIETIISRSNDNFDEFFAFTLKDVDIFFDSEGNEIDKNKYEKKVKESSSCTLSVCEVSATS